MLTLLLRRQHNPTSIAGGGVYPAVHTGIARAEDLEGLRKRLPKSLQTTAEERALLIKLGEAVGPGVARLLSIVQYNCYRRWVTKANGTYGKGSGTYKKAGRPRTAEHIRELVLKLARENNWGYTRILGELRKLDLKVSRSTVVNILRQHKFDPKLDPTKGNWGAFFKVHANRAV